MDCVGIGAATSICLARNGCKVVVVDTDFEAASRTAAIIQREGTDAFAVPGDVSVEDDCKNAVEAAITNYGRLDVLVNNVGINGPDRRPVTDIPVDEWDRIMAVNVRGMMLMARHSLKHMTPGSVIINISSVAASRPIEGHGAYPVSKGAVNSLTFAMAIQHGRQNIRVNAIVPGSVWTPLARRALQAQPGVDELAFRDRRKRQALLGTEGTAWDIADAVAFLGSDQARWITGQLLVVDGGMTLPRWTGN